MLKHGDIKHFNSVHVLFGWVVDAAKDEDLARVESAG
jgi:hypothetical protein